MTDGSRFAGRRSQSARRDAARAAILESAIALLAQGGYVTMTLADVGERAGYSRSLATHYFGSKPKLIAAVIEHLVVRDSAGSTDVLEGIDRVRAEVAAVFDGMRHRPLTLRAYHTIAHQAATAVPEILPAIHRQNQAFREVLGSAIRDGIDLGQFSPKLDADVAATSLTAMVRGVVWEWFTTPDLDLALFERVIEQQLEGWRTN